MAGPSGQTGRPNQTFYLKADFEKVADVDHAKLTASDGLILAANELKRVTDQTPMGTEANTQRFSCYGESSSRSIAGIPELQDITLTVAYDASNVLHKALLEAAVGKVYGIGTLHKKGDGEQAVYAIGTKAGHSDETPEGGPRTVAFTFALSQDWIYADKA